MNVEHAMTKDVVAVGPETSLREVARILTERHITGLPVVAEGAVVGVVSGRDLLVKESLPHDGGRRRRRRPVDARFDARTAGEAMTAPALCISSDRPLWEAAERMTAHHVQRLPVTDDDGALVGIVTRADLVRAFVRPDSDVAADLEAELVTEGVDVDVAAGEVTLRGVVATRAAARDIVERSRRVPGVTGVTSKLMWPERPLAPAGPLLPPT